VIQWMITSTSSLQKCGMNDLAKGSVVVTVVSTGNGKACADALIHAGFHIFGSVRTKADAERLQAQWAKSFTPLIFELTDEAAIASAAALVETNCLGTNLVGLVNNAGAGFDTLSCFTCQSSQSAIVRDKEINGLPERYRGKTASHPPLLH